MPVLDMIQFVLLPQMVNGLAIGIAVVLMALGLTIIFGLLDVINMSHGEFYAIGAYLALALAGIGISYWALLLLVPVLLFPLGWATESLLVQRVYNDKERHTRTLLLTFGIGMVLEDVLKLIFGPNPQRLANPIGGVTDLFGVIVPNYRLFLIAIGVLIIVAVWQFIFRTQFGASVRAAAHDPNMASSLGIPVKRVYAMTFATGVALAGLSGILLAPIYSVFPTMGRDFIFMAFAVVIVGGLGSIKGAVIAGLLLTQVQAVSSIWISPVWTEPVVFALMIATLVVRPEGLFGKLGYG
ncbi:branched-chain amino acid ABC transporter permease [Rhodoligotrophos defluvii]|uniref:branched-chain amino acid ABC transporter permease n=1 Tax=Rhodoligotrophos defluvii TaxID=2561934 RepID=UPI0010C95A05|nr:branched-chain amino acid ABC transporter permease [Rhodoligotrophos defluvii]